MERNITGVSIGGYDFKLNMYADDILLTLSKPSCSIPKVLEIIKTFGSLSGYKINWRKSETIHLHISYRSGTRSVYMEKRGD